jgi:predicted NBD/HSP70 family sugar kinase
VVELLLESLRELVGQFSGANFLAISIAVQGGIDEERGIALYLSFEPTWRNLRLKEIVESQFGIRTFIFHDPDCVLVAEKYFGSALREQYANVVTINANLGIGMSLMLRSKLYSSTFGHTGELGHTTAEPDGALCSCGKRGCLEAYASRTGIVNRFIDAVSEGRKTVIDKDAAFAINYDLVRDGALQGDPLCAGLFRQAGLYLGRSLASVATILEPDAIILYGELANDRRLYGDVLEQTFQKHVYALCQTAICYSDLPGTAPVLGAAMYALEKVLRGFLLSKA